jgi:multicomponent Na+:H+ antiporter subunit G
MSLSTVSDALGALALLLGAFMCLAGAVGLIRFPDTLSRLHAATKPQALGLILVLLGLTLILRTWAAATTLLLVGASQFFTTPVSAHLIGRSAYRQGNVRSDLLITDELSDALVRAQQEAQATESAQDQPPADPRSHDRPGEP